MGYKSLIMIKNVSSLLLASQPLSLIKECFHEILTYFLKNEN